MVRYDQLLVPRPESFVTFHPCPEINDRRRLSDLSMQAISTPFTTCIEPKMLAISARDATDR